MQRVVMRRIAVVSVVLMAAMAWLGEAAAWPELVPPFAYAAGQGIVSAIDTRTNKVVAKIQVGDFSGDVQVGPDAKAVYLSYQKSGDNHNIAVIDTRTNAVSARVLVPGSPGLIAIGPDGKSVYVTYSYNSGAGVAVIDAVTNTLTTTIATGQSISTIVVTRDGNRVYVEDQSANALIAIDAAEKEGSGYHPAR